tara:strand:+ start:364 stop:603 length:240 start_codon:yes stop_codon:yes gene_type:complete
MSDDREIKGKKSSMENFIEPGNNPMPGRDEASVFMKKRLLQHKKYLKTARGAQQAMEQIREKEEALDKIRQSNPDKPKN